MGSSPHFLLSPTHDFVPPGRVDFGKLRRGYINNIIFPHIIWIFLYIPVYNTSTHRVIYNSYHGRLYQIYFSMSGFSTFIQKN